MKTLFVLLGFLACVSAYAAPGNGIGVTLGSPNGITGRSWLTDENSIDYGLGWGLGDSRKFEVYSDYLWNRADAFEVADRKLDFFFGGGLALRTHSGPGDNEAVFGPRIPVGTSYEFTNPDLELFAVFALNLGIVPHSDVWVDLHLGARLYLF